MPRLERPDLYRMSYEALIDKVLELQESLHAGVEPETLGGGTGGGGTGGGGDAAVEGGAVTVAPPERGAQPPVAGASAKAKGKKKK